MSDNRVRDWKRVRRGEERDYTILRVREDVVEDPRNGTHHPRVIMEAPDWVQIIPVRADGKVVLVRQFRFGVWTSSLETPGGIVEPGEDPAVTAARELEEETGHRATLVKSLGWVHPNPAMQANKCHYFLGLDCEPVHSGRPDASEDVVVELRDRAEIPSLILSGQISHSLTVAAFHLESIARRDPRDHLG